MKMKLLNKITIVLAISISFFLIIGLSSCKSKKEVSQTAMTERNKEELLDIINSNILQYNTLTCKLKVNIKPGKKDKNITSNANLKLIKNDKLQLSFQPSIMGFSMEAFRLIFSVDSIIIIDRLHKMYVAESINDVKNNISFDFDIYNLQSLFTNQLFIAGKSNISKNDYKLFTVEQSKYEAMIKTKDRRNLAYTFVTDYTDKIRSTQIANQKTTLLWTYDNFSPASNQQPFPMQMNMNLNLPTDEMAMSFSFSKVDVNKETEIDLIIPDKYSRITMEQAMKILKELL